MFVQVLFVESRSIKKLKYILYFVGIKWEKRLISYRCRFLLLLCNVTYYIKLVIFITH
jgi:hypothetical protein